MPLNTKMELHDTPTSKLAEIKTYFTSDPLNGDKKHTTNDICKMIEFLVDNIYSNIPHIRNSIFHLRPKNVSYNTRLSGNEGQCFLYEGCKLITFHMSLQCLITQGK